MYSMHTSTLVSGTRRAVRYYAPAILLCLFIVAGYSSASALQSPGTAAGTIDNRVKDNGGTPVEHIAPLSDALSRRIQPGTNNSEVIAEVLTDNSCCDLIGISFSTPLVVPHPCCRRVSVYRLPGFDCDIYGISVHGIEGSGIPLQETPIQLFGPANPTPVTVMCPEFGETKFSTIELLDQDGNVICTKVVKLSCPSGNSCCDSIDISISPADTSYGPCCRQISINRLSELNCDIYGVVHVENPSEGGIPLQGTPITLSGPGNPTPVFVMCPSYGEVRIDTLAFLDQNGDTICFKTVSINCSYATEMEKRGDFGLGEGLPEMSVPMHLYPNPATGETVISYEMLSGGMVRLELFDPIGKPVAVIDEGVKAQGTHTQKYNVGTLPAGTYLVRLSTPGGIVSLPLVVSKE